MAQLRQDYARFTDAKLKVVGVSPNKPDAAKAFRAAHDLPYPMLADPQRVAYQRYGLGKLSVLHEINPLTWLRNRGKLKQGVVARASDADMTQLGGVFIIDPRGTLRYTHVAEDAADNPPTEEILGGV